MKMNCCSCIIIIHLYLINKNIPRELPVYAFEIFWAQRELCCLSIIVIHLYLINKNIPSELPNYPCDFFGEKREFCKKLFHCA